MSKPIPEELLSAYLDGELSPSEMESVREQLTIKENADKLATLRKNQTRLRQLPSFQLGDDFAERVIAAIEFEDSADSTPQKQISAVNSGENAPWRLALVAILSLAAMVILAMFMRPPAPEDREIVRTDPSDLMESRKKELAGAEGIAPEGKTLADQGERIKTLKNSLNQLEDNKLPIAIERDKSDKEFDRKKNDDGSVLIPGSKKIKKSEIADSIKKKAPSMSQPRAAAPGNQTDNRPRDEKSPKGSLANNGASQKTGGGGPPSVPPTQTLQVYNQNFVNNELEEIVHVKVCQSDFDNYSVEKALLSNKISCEIPPNQNKNLKNNVSGKDSRTARFRSGPSNIRFLMVEAPDDRLISTFKQLKNVRIDPLVLADTTPQFQQQQLQNWQNNQFGAGGAGAGGGMGLGKNQGNARGGQKGGQKGDRQDGQNPKPSQSQQKTRQQLPANPKYADIAQNRARNYVHPTELPKSELRRRAEKQRIMQQQYDQNYSTSEESESKIADKADRKSKSRREKSKDQQNESFDKKLVAEDDNDEVMDSPELRRISEHFALLPQPPFRRMLLVIQSDPKIDAEIAQAKLNKAKQKSKTNSSTVRPKK